MDPSSVAVLFVVWNDFVVTLDQHRVGAVIFLLLIFIICYSIWRRP